MIKKTTLLLVMLLAAAAGAQAIRITQGPYLQNLTQNEVTVVWLTDTNSIGWVELTDDDTRKSFYDVPHARHYDTDCGVKRNCRVHYVRLTGLKPGTTYKYRVYATAIDKIEVEDNGVGSKVYYGRSVGSDPYNLCRFTTSDDGATRLSFAMFNDIHGNNDKLRALTGKIDLKSTNMIVFNGDMCSNMRDENQVFADFMSTAVQLFAKNMPVYYVRGNHETRGPISTDFHKYFSPSENKIYYAFRYGPAYFIMLDTGEDKPDTDIEYYGITDYDNYRTEQGKWLEQVTQSDAYKSAPFKIVIGHMPPTLASDGAWHGEVDCYNKFVPALNQAKPDVYLAGHYHSYSYRPAGTSGVDFPILINSNDAIVKVSIDGNSMKLDVVDTSGKLIDSHTITK